MESNLEYRRTLPPELLSEIHKCLPLIDAIHILVNVPTRAIYQNNSPRMRRTIERIKTFLKEYVDKLPGDDEEEEEEGDDDDDFGIIVNNDFEWKPEFDAFLRYGSWLTTDYRQLLLEGSIVGVPENFVEKLFLHLTNSRSAQTMLDYAHINFQKAPIPVPTFLKPLLNELLNEKQIGEERFLIDDSFELKTDDGQILHIYEAALIDNIELNLIVVNKDKKNWFKIHLFVTGFLLLNDDYDYSKEICALEFKRWKMQSLSDVKKSLDQYNGSFEQSGNILEAKKEVLYEPSLDMFLRRGTAFSQFRHFKIKQDYFLYPEIYDDFLISYISNAKHPEDFLDSIDMNLKNNNNFKFYSSLNNEFWKDCRKGIPKDGKFIKFGNEELHILSAKAVKNKLEFTLRNRPTNGAYVFDVEVQFEKEGPSQIIGIKIQKRVMNKIGDNIELNCNDQIEELGKKRKASNNDEEDEPTCSNKIMKN